MAWPCGVGRGVWVDVHLIRTQAATRVSAAIFRAPVTMIIAWMVFAETLSLNGIASYA